MTTEPISTVNFDVVITHNVVAMRAEPNGGSEQVSQAIWGDNALRLAQEGEFVRIRTADDYEGWVWERHLRPLDPALLPEGASFPHSEGWPFGERVGLPRCVTADFAILRDRPGQEAEQASKLVFGTWVQTPLTERPKEAEGLLVQLPRGWREEDARQIQVGYVDSETVYPVAAANDEYPRAHGSYGANGAPSDRNYPYVFSGDSLCVQARSFLGTPYLWGGTTPFGFDCSGFVQRMYAMHGILLPRDAYLQADSPLGERLAPDVPAQAGDLVFFGGRSDPRKRGITHVGMALNADAFIHAVGKEGIIITPFDDPYYAAQYTYFGAWRYPAPTL